MLVDVFRRYIVVGCIVVLLAWGFFSLRYVLLVILIVLIVVFLYEYKNRRTRERRRLLSLGLERRPNSQYENSKTARSYAIATRDHRRIISNSTKHYVQTHDRRENDSTNNYSSGESRLVCNETFRDSVSHGAVSPRRHEDFLLNSVRLRSSASFNSPIYKANTTYEDALSDKSNKLNWQRQFGDADTPSCINRLARLENSPTRRILTSYRRYPTHQEQYPLLGSYPTVRLSSPKTPIFNASRSTMGLSPVTVKIAPVETLQSNPRWSFIYSPSPSPSKTSVDPCDAKTIIAALRESRKRGRNVKHDLVEENGAKRLRHDTTSSSGSTIPSKFGSSTGMASTSLSPYPEEGILFNVESGKRQATPAQFSFGSAIKRHQNNAVYSSYSSSQHKSRTSPMEDVTSSMKRKAESGQSVSPQSKTSKLQNSSGSAQHPKSQLEPHQSQENEDVGIEMAEATEMQTEVVTQKSPPAKESSTKSPLTKEGAINKRTFSLYASLENTSKKDYNFPNHLTTLEEFKQDKKLEEGRLKRLLKGIMDDVDDGSSKPFDSQNGGQVPVFFEERNSSSSETVSQPPMTLLSSSTPSSVNETMPTTSSLFASPTITTTSSVLPTSLFATHTTTAATTTTALPINLFESPTVSTTSVSLPTSLFAFPAATKSIALPPPTATTTSFSVPLPASKQFESPVTKSSLFLPPPPPYSLAVAETVSETPATLPTNLFAQNRESSTNVKTIFGFTNNGPTSSIPQFGTAMTASNLTDTQINVTSTFTASFASTSSLTATTATSLETTSSLVPTFGSGLVSFPKSMPTETTFSYTSPISSTTAKPTAATTNGFQISSISSGPIASPFSIGTPNVTSTTALSGLSFLSNTNSQPKLKEVSMSFGTLPVTSTAVIGTGSFSHSDNVEKPSVTISNTRPNLFAISSMPASQSTTTTNTTATHPISFASLQPQSVLPKSPFAVNFSSSSTVPSLFGTSGTSSTPLFGSALAPTRMNVSTSSLTFGTPASSAVQSSFFASASPSVAFGNPTTLTAPSQKSNIFGGNAATPGTTSSAFMTTPQPSAVFGSRSTVGPVFGSTTPNLFGGFGPGKTSVPTFGATATTETSSSIFGNFGQNQSVFAPSNMEFGSSALRPTFSLNNTGSVSNATPFQLANPINNQLAPSFNLVSSAPNFNFGSTAEKPVFTFGSSQPSNENSAIGGIQPQPFNFTAGSFSTPTSSLFSIGASSGSTSTRDRRLLASRRKTRK